MFYAKCPTCKTVFSNKQLIYEEEMKKICEKYTKDDLNAKRKELLHKLELRSECCIMRMMTYVDLQTIIKPIK